jgi:WD40 repeat protein
MLDTNLVGFSLIPNELLQMIFTRVALKDLVSLSSVCKTFNHFLNNDHNFWKLIYKREKPFSPSLFLEAFNQQEGSAPSLTYKRLQHLLTHNQKWGSYSFSNVQKFSSIAFYQNEQVFIKGDITNELTLQEIKQQQTFFRHSVERSCHTYASPLIFIGYQQDLMITAHQDGALFIWNLKNDESICYPYTLQIKHIDCNQNVIAVAEEDSLSLFNFTSGDITKKYSWEIKDSFVSCLKLQDSTLFIGYEDGRLISRNIQTEELVKYQSDQLEAVSCLTVDSLRLISGSKDKTIKIWNVKTQRLICTLIGHEYAISCLHLKENILISGDIAGTIKIWDCDNGKCLNTLTKHTKKIDFLLVSQDAIVSHCKEEEIVYQWYFEPLQESKISNLVRRSLKIVENIFKNAY